MSLLGSVLSIHQVAILTFIQIGIILLSLVLIVVWFDFLRFATLADVGQELLFFHFISLVHFVYIIVI